MNQHKWNNNFMLGFIVCFGLFFLMGLTQNSNRYKEETEIFREFQNLYMNVQPKQFTVRSSTPTTADIQEGEIIITNIGGTQHLFTRISNKLYRTLLTEN